MRLIDKSPSDKACASGTYSISDINATKDVALQNLLIVNKDHIFIVPLYYS